MKNTEKEYWFKRRRYGFGWTPACWQGWAVVIVFLIIFVVGKKMFDDNLIYSIFMATAIISLVIASLYKGPKPKWRWGRSKDDNPSEDI